MTKAAAGVAGATVVLLTLAAGQFVMALDTTVMNTAIATVAKDLDTTVTGIQTAITLYTLVMASLMITGGKIGSILGRKRAFAIGCVIYASGSLTTSTARWRRGPAWSRRIISSRSFSPRTSIARRSCKRSEITSRPTASRPTGPVFGTRRSRPW